MANPRCSCALNTCSAPHRVLLPPDDSAVPPERLPGWGYPSDHIALFAELFLQPDAPAAPEESSAAAPAKL